MQRKKWKRGKAVLPLLLSALLIAEPVVTVSTVYAEELPQASQATEPEQEEESSTNEIPVEETEGTEQKPDSGAADGAEQDNNDSANENGDVTGEEEDEGSSSEDTDNKDDASENPAEGEEGDEQENEGDGEEEAPDTEDPVDTEEPADTEDPAEEEEDTEEEEVPEEEELPEDEAEAKLEGFSGMPSTYKLTPEQMEGKQSLSDCSDGVEGQEGADYVEGEVVTFAESQEEAEMIAEAYNAQITDFAYGILTLKLNDADSVEKAVRVAADMELNMPAVWPNYRRYLQEEVPVTEDAVATGDDGIEVEITEYDADGAEVSDEEASYLSVLDGEDPYLQPESDFYQYQHLVVGSPYAWAAGHKGQGVTVAVLDSGVAAHNDLPAVNSIYGAGTTDNHGHGTHVAGIIGARANGQLGSGIAPEVTLLSGNLGNIYSSDVMKGIRAAVDANADIINMSIGGIGKIGNEQIVVNEAYNAGVAIFAAASNDGGQNYSYPASYDHVISVAATDKTNARASFSNYNNMVDLSAPGVSIWSTDAGNASGYVSMGGTSMACPVAAGEAAVILSGDAELKAKSGPGRVDALEKLMKQNAVKAGSGMGAGITSLTKVFKLSTASAKPMAPDIVITPDNESEAQNVRVTITAQSGMSIYYTINGKNPVYKNGQADAKTDTRKYTGTFAINDRAKATVKAIAVNESGVSGAIKSASYTMKPYVTSITISGVQKVVPQKSIQLSATVLPAYATNKGVTWELRKEDGTVITPALSTELGIKIAANGKVTTTNKATAGKYDVVVTAKDKGGVQSAPYRIEVINGLLVKSAKFNLTPKTLSLVLPNQKSYDLSANLEAEPVTEGTAITAADFIWTSSNNTIAKVSGAGVVKPVKSGKVTITALANDSSGKKATCTVVITERASSIKVTGPATIAATKSGAFKAEIKPASATNKKVTWELYKDGKIVDKKTDKTFADQVGVSISATGKVTATKNAQAGEYTVKAISTDKEELGTPAAGETTFKVTKAMISKLSFEPTSDSKVTLYRTATAYTNKTTATVKVKVDMQNGTDADLNAYTVSNNNPGVVSVTDSGQAGGYITLQIKATGRSAGKANIVITSSDGSNKQATCAVTVVNPVSAITIAPAAGSNNCVAQGKTLQLKAAVSSEHGVISNKNVTWELYAAAVSGNRYVMGDKLTKELENSLGISIAANGKVKAAKTAQLDANGYPVKYFVKATAKDGSGVSGTYMISVGNAATELDILGSYTDSWGIPHTGVVNNMSFKVAVNEEGKVYSFGVESKDLYQGGFTVSSSNPAVASATYEPMQDENGNSYVDAGYLKVTVYKKGAANITVKAMDGGGKQAKIRLVAN